MALEAPIELWVPGVPIPQGSLKAFVRPHPIKHRGTGQCSGGQGYVSMTSDNDNLKAWRDHVKAVAFAVRARHGMTTLDEPLEICATFFLPRPKSLHKTVVYPIGKPDLDKLMRAIGDALTDAALIFDDSRFVNEITYKRYAPTPAQAGVAITLRGVE